jgi:hypothetical protein
LAVTLLFTVTLVGCEDNADPQPEELQGIEFKTGYGDAHVVTENGADLYQFTRHSCLKADSLSNDEVAQLFINPELSNNQTVLTIKASYD